MVTITETIARAMLTVDYAESEQKHPGITAEELDDDYALEGYIAQAQAAITALTEAGYAIVPAVPSEGMLKAGEWARKVPGTHTVDRIYRAMIEAGRAK